MVDAGAGEKLKVFISYSRKDSTAFADELLAGLEAAGFAPYLDRHDIVPGEPWQARLGGLIEQSDTVVFVISPEAVKSEQCTWEVDRTRELSKRLLPVIFKSVPDDDIPEKLRRLEYVRFDTEAKFARLFQLAEALRVDLDWIREHTRLGELATRWDRRGRPESALLRGGDLGSAKRWIAARKAGAPEITEAQRGFVRASEEAETARLGKERAQLEATARQQKRFTWMLGVVAFLLLAFFGYVTWQSDAVARRELNVFTARAADALNNEQFDLAMRYALQVYPARGRLPWTAPFSTELEGKLAGSALSTRLHRVLKGHSAEVESAAFSPDDKRVVTTSEDNTARIWDAQSGKEITILQGHTNAVVHAAFSADSKRVLTTSYDNTVRIWEAESGKEILVLKGDTESTMRTAFSADGKYALISSADNTARVWDAESGKEIAVLKGHTDSLSYADFSADGKQVVTTSNDDTARIWDAQSGKQITVLKDGLMLGAAFSGDGKRVLTKSYSTARIWDAEGGNEIAVLAGNLRGVRAIRFSDDGKRLVAGSDNGARIWDAATGNEIVTLEHPGAVSRAAFSADDKRVLTASEDNTARIWDAATGKEIVVLKGHTAGVRSARFSVDGTRVVTASFDNTARIWGADSGEQIVLRGHTAPVSRAAFSADGKRVLTVDDNTMRIWDAATGNEIVTLERPRFVSSAAFSADGKRVLTASDDNIARIRDAESKNEIAALKGHTSRLFSAAFSADGKWAVTGSEDNTARVWDAASGKEIAVLNHTLLVWSAAFSTDGKRILTASHDVYIWDAESYETMARLSGGRNFVLNAAFSADGKRVVTGSTDKTARVWDLESGKQIVLKGHTGAVSSAAFSADGKRVLTASEDNTARIWDAATGTQIAVVKTHALAFSADGKWLLTASDDNTAHIRDVAWATLEFGDALRERVCAEKLIGAAQEFTDGEIDGDPILRGIDKNDPVARNPCLRRGPLSLDYWTRLPSQLWRATRKLVGVS